MAINEQTKITVPFAASGLKNTIPNAPTGSNLASMQEGFPSITMSAIAEGGQPPDGKDMNGILNLLSLIAQYAQSGGLYQYDANYASEVGGYPVGAILRSASGKNIYLNLVANNATNPDKNGTNWVTLADMTALNAAIDGEATTRSNADNALQLSINNLIQSLAKVATSGSYADLLNKPTKLSQFSNDVPFATQAEVDTKAVYPTQAGNKDKYLKTDGTNVTWEYVPTRNVGEVVMSLIPLTDAGLHLLDGSLLDAGGIYDAFIVHVASFETTYPNLFCTEDEFQSVLLNKGSCGKFVLTKGSNGALVSLRIPKVVDILQGTSDANAVGDMLDAGLPNIAGTFEVINHNPSQHNYTGAFETATIGNMPVSGIDTGESWNEGWGTVTEKFNASRSNPIYGRSTTVQQQAIKALFYICVATTAKTDIEVNIDNIATDLNGKLSKSGGDITGRTTIAATDFIVTTTVANAAGVHNSIFRGKYLGSSITEAQSAAIRAGTFDDLYIGDYWIINNVKYVIVAFDFYLHTGDTECTTHHIVVVPEKALYQAQMNSSNTTEGAYVGSAMYKTNLNSAKSTILAAFGSSHLLSIRQYFQNAMANAIPTGGIWTDATVFLMSEMNVYGCRIYGAVINGTNWPTLYTTDNRQYPYFAMNNLLQSRNNFWLRDVCSAYYFAFVHSRGTANYNNASDSLGVRPAFCVI